MGKVISVFSLENAQFSACGLAQFSELVVGLSQSGQSSSDSWLLNVDPSMLPNRKEGSEGKVLLRHSLLPRDKGEYREEKYNVFLKYFLEYDTYVKYFINKASDEYKRHFVPMFTDSETNQLIPEYRAMRHTIADSSNINTLGLNYELRVYSLVTKPILDNLVSPFFVESISTSTSCSYQSLENIVHKKGIPKYNLLRNIAYFLLGLENRPSIEDPVEVRKEDVEERTYAAYDYNIGNFSTKHVDGLMRYIESIKDELKFGFILNKAISPGTLDLYRTIEKYGSIYVDKSNTQLSPWFIDVFFQLSTVLYVMKCAGFRHNDLHGENIWIEFLDRPKRLDMIYNKKRYSIKTRHLVKVYDYDFSSVSFLGISHKAKKNLMNIPGDEENDDPLISQLNALFNYIINKGRKQGDLNIPIGRLISASGYLTEDDGVVYSMFAKNGRIRESLNFLEEKKIVAPIETIMDRLYDIHPSKVDDFDDIERVYIADPSIFNEKPSDGDYSNTPFINTSNLTKLRREVLMMIG